jgi:hypothetical protein
MLNTRKCLGFSLRGLPWGQKNTSLKDSMMMKNKIYSLNSPTYDKQDQFKEWSEMYINVH